ncbi:MAG: cysteine desulfurase family protein (TIGR01976 family) [Woeseiaceae bacterium]|jgi:cysteine desulfurase family protein (TIGR01976 family)|tara:strand:+ start:41821 stop:43095 length:1275 start_codon:yes stop_codon:yes gene_type:complete
MNYNLDEIRSMFPALSVKDEGKRRIYFDNPAGTQVSQKVVEAMSDCLIYSNANILGGFETSNRADQVLSDARNAMTNFLNARSSDEIIFGQNMTTITLHMSRSIGKTLSSGDEIILSRMCHDANISPWLLLAKDLNLKIKWLSFNKETFEFDLSELDTLMTEKTKLICVGGASNLLGTINNIKSICQKATSMGVLSYIDAVQLAPHVAINVQDIECDFLICSAYKFFGPHQGILWGKREVLKSLEPYKVRPATSELPSCFETGTQSHEGMAGISAAVNYFAWVGDKYAKEYTDNNQDIRPQTRSIHAALNYLFEYETILTDCLIEGLQTINHLTIQGITKKEALERRLPTVAFTIKGKKSPDIAAALARENIFVWSGHSYALEIMKTLDLYDTGGVVRIGPVHYNSTEEIKDFIKILEKVLSAK